MKILQNISKHDGSTSRSNCINSQLSIFQFYQFQTIPHWFGFTSENLKIELHGFSDASQDVIAAVIYIRVLNSIDVARVTLAAAKTKVAPLKRAMIPRIKLSVAVLLVKHMAALQNSLDLQHLPIHLWIDSTIALTCTKGHPSQWKDFVRNRISFI